MKNNRLMTRRQMMRGTALGGFAMALVPALPSLLAAEDLAFGKTVGASSNDVETTKIIPNISSFMLDNGLQVVVIPDRRAPVVTHMIWYKVGSADEPEGKSGIAHYLEHLMFKGTKRFANNEFSMKVAEVGGTENAFTSFDYTSYFQKVTPQTLEMVMDMEADRMENLILTDETVLPERKVILEERRQRISQNPGSILQESVQSTLFKHHPYGTPIIGWEHEMLQLTKDDAIAFYDRFYTPNNAILVIAGDVDEARVKELAQKTYGRVKRRAEPPKERVRVKEPEPVTERRVSYADERITRPSWQRNYLVPSYHVAEGNEGYSLEMLAAVLSGSFSSRINLAMVLDNPMTTGAGAYYSGGALNLGEFGFYASPKGKTSLDEVEAKMDEIIQEVIAKGVTQKELDQARNALLKTTIYQSDSQTSLARIVGSSLATGGTIDELQQWPARLMTVTPQEVQDVAKKYLDKSRSVTGILLPKQAATGDKKAAVETKGQDKS